MAVASSCRRGDIGARGGKRGEEGRGSDARAAKTCLLRNISGRRGGEGEGSDVCTAMAGFLRDSLAVIVGEALMTKRKIRKSVGA